jgi:hypothetical protein
MTTIILIVIIIVIIIIIIINHHHHHCRHPTIYEGKLNHQLRDMFFDRKQDPGFATAQESGLSIDFYADLAGERGVINLG